MSVTIGGQKFIGIFIAANGFLGKNISIFIVVVHVTTFSPPKEEK
jgi:hypothetical protein